MYLVGQQGCCNSSTLQEASEGERGERGEGRGERGEGRGGEVPERSQQESTEHIRLPFAEVCHSEEERREEKSNNTSRACRTPPT